MAKVPETIQLPLFEGDYKDQLAIRVYLNKLNLAVKRAYEDLAGTVNYNWEHRNDA